MYCEKNDQLMVLHHDYHFPQMYSIEYQTKEVKQWQQNNTEDSDEYKKDMYFDCVEHLQDEYDLIEEQKYDQLYNNHFISICVIDYPWISEICLSVHRKTNIFHRFLNYFNRSRRQSLSNLAEEFIRAYTGRFNHPIGFHFHLSYAKEKWLLILKNFKFVNYGTYPYPQTRVIFIRKGVLYIVRS